MGNDCCRNNQHVRQHGEREIKATAPGAPVQEDTAGAGKSASSGKAGSADTIQLRSEYVLGEVLGQGAFGVVYACAKIKSPGDMDFAVKMVDKVETPLAEIKAEADMLKLLAHKNIVKFHDLYYEKFFVCIVMDRYKGGDLIEGMQRHWKKLGQIPCTKVIHVSRQMCEAIRHMHSKNVVHRDVKGDNYLMDDEDLLRPETKIILSDFGTARQMPENGKTLKDAVGTKIYWPPEFFSASYGLKVDVWALGVIMYGLLVGRFPFKGEQETRYKVVKLPQQTPSQCQSYIKGLLERNEQKRLSADQAFNHDWLWTDGKNVDYCPASTDFTPELVAENGANAGVLERRDELLERMGPKTKKRDEGMVAALKKDVFHINNKAAGRQLSYAWWTREKVRTQGVLNIEMAVPEQIDQHPPHPSLEVLKKMLTEHDIDPRKFGQDTYKPLPQFATEVQKGLVVLMLDATQHKKLVRVVDVVLLRIVLDIPDKGRHVFIEVEEEFCSDGRAVKKKTRRLPGTKKEPHENLRTCSQRILRDIVGFPDDVPIRFDYKNKEAFEEEVTSPSYPIDCVYRKEIVVGVIRWKEIVDRRAEIGLGKTNVTHEVKSKAGMGTKKVYDWTTEAYEDKLNDQSSEEWQKFVQRHELRPSSAGKLGANLRPPPSSDAISALVQAPIGYSVDELRGLLEAHCIDPDSFGFGVSKTLAQFSTELVKGEACLIFRDKDEKEKCCDKKYYDHLGVDSSAHKDEIDEAYNKRTSDLRTQREKIASVRGGDEGDRKKRQLKLDEVDRQLQLLKWVRGVLLDDEKRKQYDAWGAGGPTVIVRVVDVVCLLLIEEKKENKVLVMTHETIKCKETGRDLAVHQLMMLPGAKRRPDENQFLTAQRVLKRQLKLDENCIDLDATNVQIIEEEKESSSYPGIITLYRKRLIDAHLRLPADGSQASN